MYSVNTKKLFPLDCPGSTVNDCIALTKFMAGESVAGGRLKETGLAHWLSPDTGATNDYGFTALPGGDRNINGAFNNIGINGNWWSLTESNASNAWFRQMSYNTNSIIKDDHNKLNGFSVRCVKK